MDRVNRDFRVALRGLLRTPSFTSTSIFVLAVGIGMAVAMFTVFDAVLVHKLPVRDQDRIVELFTYRGDANADYWMRREDLKTVQLSSRTLRGIAGVVHWGAPESPMIDGDRPVLVNRTMVTGNFFEVLGARPALGRLLRASDEMPGVQPVLVISYSTWQKQFGGDSAVIGRRLLEPYARQNLEIVGVAPPGLEYPSGVGMWMTFFQPSNDQLVKAISYLAPSATPGSAQREFFDIMRKTHPDRNYDGVHAQTFTHAVLGNVKPVLTALVSAVALLLLIACVNVGNLLLMRATGRSRELSIRRAIGATSGDLVRLLVVESTMLGAVGGLLGLVVAVVLVKVLVVIAPPGLPRLDAIGIAGMPIVICIAVTTVATLIFGVVPALAASHGELVSSLRSDSRGGAESRTRRTVRRALVASQIALALVMLAGAGLLGRTLAHLQNLSLGYQPDHLALLSVSFPPSVANDSTGKFSQDRVYALGDQLQTKWRGISGVQSVTPILTPPFLGANIFIGRLDKEGQSPQEMTANPYVPVEVGGADYFRTFNIAMKSGRVFTHADNEKAPDVAIVSEAVARRFWPNESPIGKRIHFWNSDTTAWRTVVGVAGDIHWRSLRESTPSVYVPWRQAYWQGSFAVRTSTNLSNVVDALRRSTREVNSTVGLWETRPMETVLESPMAQPKLTALLIGAFAIVSLMLAAVGLYGVMASTVRASTREFGVRLALGASPERLRRAVLKQAAIVAGVGAAIGMLIALAGSRLLSSLLFEVSPTDPVSLIGSAVTLMAVALVAAYVPAYRATQVNPMEALRAE
ncbi:MAG: ADOP family duplicated permease [Gemmatimonadaceae bacterium]